MIIENFGATAYSSGYTGGTTLPTGYPIQDMHSDRGQLQAVAIPEGGLWANSGTGILRLEPPELRCLFRVTGATLSAIDTTIDALRALRGKYLRLWAAMGDASRRFRWAWLTGLDLTARPDYSLMREIALTFQLHGTCWNGTERGTSSSELGASPTTLVVANSGNVRVTNPVITVVAATTDITALTVVMSGVSSWTFSNTLEAGNTLVVDCGARTVRENGTDAFSGFALNAAHYIPEWIRLEPGNNTLTITRTGGGNTSTIKVNFYDGWA